MEAPSKAFLLFFLLPDWLKLNHLKSRMGCIFRHFSRHICSTVAETIGVTNFAACFGAKNVQKTIFEAAEMVLGPWNQQLCLESQSMGQTKFRPFLTRFSQSDWFLNVLKIRSDARQ